AALLIVTGARSLIVRLWIVKFASRVVFSWVAPAAEKMTSVAAAGFPTVTMPAASEVQLVPPQVPLAEPFQYSTDEAAAARWTESARPNPQAAVRQAARRSFGRRLAMAVMRMWGEVWRQGRRQDGFTRVFKYWVG